MLQPSPLGNGSNQGSKAPNKRLHQEGAGVTRRYKSESDRPYDHNVGINYDRSFSLKKKAYMIFMILLHRVPLK